MTEDLQNNESPEPALITFTNQTVNIDGGVFNDEEIKLNFLQKGKNIKYQRRLSNGKFGRRRSLRGAVKEIYKDGDYSFIVDTARERYFIDLPVHPDKLKDKPILRRLIDKVRKKSAHSLNQAKQ